MKELIIKAQNITIRVDEDNKILLAYDHKDEITDESSEGILKVVSPFIFDKIKKKLNINPADYGVEENDEAEIDLSFLNKTI